MCPCVKWDISEVEEQFWSDAVPDAATVMLVLGLGLGP